MRWTYSYYSKANVGITVGAVFGSALFVIIVVLNRFHTPLEKMFGIKYTRSENGPAELNLYGND